MHNGRVWLPHGSGCACATGSCLLHLRRGVPLQSDWNVVKRGWEAHVLGEAPNRFRDPVEALRTLKALSSSHPRLLLRLHAA
jgi:hypothetical protein